MASMAVVTLRTSDAASSAPASAAAGAERASARAPPETTAFLRKDRRGAFMAERYLKTGVSGMVRPAYTVAPSPGPEE